MTCGVDWELPHPGSLPFVGFGIDGMSMSRLRQASMLRKPQLTHIRQVAPRPEIKQVAHGSGRLGTNGVSLPLTGAPRVYAFQAFTDLLIQHRPLAAPAKGLARRDGQAPRTDPTRRTARTSPTGRPTAAHQERHPIPDSRNSFEGVFRSTVDAAHVLFRLQNCYSLARK